ncbi:MAG: hypothetical protein RIC56_15210 [Pseudomonadales bacterium]
MTSATCRALILTTLLAVAAPSIAGAGRAMTHDHADTHSAVERSDGADPVPTADLNGDNPTAQTLSTLGALALGVVGLLWVRRHTAQL